MLRGGNEGGYWEELEWRERLKGWCDQNMCLCMEVNVQLNGNVGWSIKNEKRGRFCPLHTHVHLHLWSTQTWTQMHKCTKINKII